VSIEQAAAQPLVLTPSERVLLDPERFSPAAGMLGYSEVSLVSGRKVDADKLAERMLAAALLAVRQAGGLALERRSSKAMFGLMNRETLHAVPGPRTPSWPQGSLEAALGPRLAGNPGVEDLVAGLLGAESASPGQRLCGMAKAGLGQRGVLQAEEKKTLKLFTSIVYTLPEANRAAVQSAGSEHVQALLAACERDHPELWTALLKAIRAALVRMTESRD
jgi:hypothetical protein